METTIGNLQGNMQSRSLGAHFRLPAHFNRLPVELVTVIFTLALHRPEVTGLALTPPQNSRTAATPLIFSAVCQRWRRIAASTPLLWTRLNLRFRRPLPHLLERTLLRDWLERVGSCMITLTLYRSLYERPQNLCADAAAGIEDEIHDLLSPTFSQCKALRLHDVPFTKIPPLHDNSLDIYPNMKELSLSSYLGFVGELNLRPMPMLRSLSAFQVRYSRMQCLEAHFHSLRVLHTRGDMQEVYDILSQMVCLAELKLSVIYVGHAVRPRASLEHMQSLPHLMLHELRCIVLPDLYGAVAACLINKVTMPSLISFEVVLTRPQFSNHPSLWSPLFSCILRSKPPLENLSLTTHVLIPVQELIDTLGILSMLRTFELRAKTTEDVDTESLSQAVLKALSVGADPKSLCPKLEKLELSGLTSHNLSDVFAIIIARFRRSWHTHPQHRNTSSMVDMQFLSIEPCNFTLFELWEYPGVKELTCSGLVMWVNDSSRSLVVEERRN